MFKAVSLCLGLFWIFCTYATLYTANIHPEERRRLGKGRKRGKGGDSSSSSSDDATTTTPAPTRRGMFADLFTYEEFLEISQNKRIRREIRDLSCEQWNRVAAAMNIMKYTNEEEGKKLYGDNFRSYDSLVCQHARGSLNANGDMMHYGPQFLPTHRAYVLAFENSLIAIDPEIDGAPYWNYFIDINELGNDITDSIIFSDEYFGQVNGDPAFGGAVSNGKFKFWKINTDQNETPLCGDEYRNAFGQLRLNTNFENNEYYTRHGNNVCNTEYDWLGVQLYNECLNNGNLTDITSFYWCMNPSVHDTPHGVIGGDLPQFDGQIVDGLACTSLFLTWQLPPSGSFKYGNNNNCFICPQDNNIECIIGVDDFKCAQCDINIDELEKGENGTCFGFVAPFLGGAYPFTIENLDVISNWDSQHFKGDFTDISTSPNDPIFMPHHANVERYWLEWQLRNYNNKPYYGYPQFGYPTGINLDDIMTDEFPFNDLFNGQVSGPHTFRQLFDNTDFINSPYTYDTIIDLIYQEPQ